jgi:hypothetical protein
MNRDVPSPADTVYVLVNLNGGGLAQWGKDDTTPTGPVAFGSIEDAERFKKSMPAAAADHQVTRITMGEILSRAAAQGWTELWAVTIDRSGKPTWYAYPLPSTEG